jgi:hypothetical protein
MCERIAALVVRNLALCVDSYETAVYHSIGFRLCNRLVLKWFLFVCIYIFILCMAVLTVRHLSWKTFRYRKYCFFLLMWQEWCDITFHEVVQKALC